MLFDPFINGVAELHDRHRDMRLDVDNMSYEVNLDVLYYYYSFFLYFFFIKKIYCLNKFILGIVGIGRTHRKCEHRAK